MRSVLWNFPNRFNWHHQFSILHGLHCVIYIIETNCLFREFLSYRSTFSIKHIYNWCIWTLKLHKAFCSSTQTVLYPFLFITHYYLLFFTIKGILFSMCYKKKTAELSKIMNQIKKYSKLIYYITSSFIDILVKFIKKIV